MNKKNDSEISADLSIYAYMHCGQCLDEWKSNPKINKQFSPRDWAAISVGWTEKGFQVWCYRHEINICHVDFEGHKHPANITSSNANLVCSDCEEGK